MNINFLKNDEKPAIDLNKFIDFFEKPETSIYFVHRTTGEIIEQLHEDSNRVTPSLFMNENYLQLPLQKDFDIFRVMRDFCRTIKESNVQEAISFTIQGKGAFGRFKKAVSFHKIEDLWNKHRHQRIKQFAIQWCRENGFTYKYERPVDLGDS